jgi:hypothetical protein
VAVIALLLGYSAVSRTTDHRRSERLRQENLRLEQQLGEISGRLSSLTDTLSRIAQQDAKIRVLANLEPIDPQVQAAGIGGPTVAPRPALPNEGPALRRSQEIRVDLNALIRRANLLASSFEEAKDSLASHSQRLAATPSIMPTQGWLTSAFSSMREHPILHVARPHEGIDVTAPMGSPIEAPAAGVVTDAGWESGYGNTITIDHGYGVVTKFAHASKLRCARASRSPGPANRARGQQASPPAPPATRYVTAAVDPLRYVLPEHVATDEGRKVKVKGERAPTRSTRAPLPFPFFRLKTSPPAPSPPPAPPRSTPAAPGRRSWP